MKTELSPNSAGWISDGCGCQVRRRVPLIGSRFGSVVVVVVGCEQSGRHAVVAAGCSPDIVLLVLLRGKAATTTSRPPQWPVSQWNLRLF